MSEIMKIIDETETQKQKTKTKTYTEQDNGGQRL